MVATLWDKITGLSAAGAVSPSRLEEELVALFDRLRVPLLRYLLSLRIPAADAEEIVQEVFLSLFQHLRQGKPRTNLEGWVFTVAHNLGLKHRTSTRRHADYFSDLPDLSGIPGDLAPRPHERMEMIERQQRLLAVIRALPEQDRCCLSLRAEGLRYREIAGVLGISLGAVAGSLARSLSRLGRAGDY